MSQISASQISLSLSIIVPDEGTFQLGKDMSGVKIHAYFNRLGHMSNFGDSNTHLQFASSTTDQQAQVLHGSIDSQDLSLRYLCFQAKTTLRLGGNDREDLLSQTKISLVRLARLVQSTQQDPTQAAKTLKIPIQMWDHSMVTQSNKNVERGTFTLCVHATPDTRLPTSVLVESAHSDNEQQFQEVVGSLFDSFSEMPQAYGVQPVLPEAAQMRVPFFRTNAMPIPAAFFVWFKPFVVRQPDVIPLYVAQYQTLLTASLAFHGNLSEDRFCEVVDALIVKTSSSTARGGGSPASHDIHMACRIMASVFSLQATAMNYKSDRTVGDQLSERFKICRNGDLGGDCEDLGKEIHLSATLFMDIGDINSGEHLKGAMLSMYRLSNCFVWTMISGMVSSPSIEQTSSGGPEFGNHIYAGAIPREYFLQMVEGSLPPTIIKDLRRTMYQRQPRVHGESGLRLMILEGTGWTNPLQNAWSAYVDSDAVDLKKVTVTKQRAVSRVESIALRKYPVLRDNFTRERQQRRLAVTSLDPMQGFPTLDEFSPFYKYIIGIWVDLRPYGVDFYCDFLAIDRSTKKYGIDFRQFVGQHKSVVLLPQFHLNSHEQMASITWALSCQAPFVPPLANPIVLRHNRVKSTSRSYHPFAHPQAKLFVPRLFFNLRTRVIDTLDVDSTKQALAKLLTDRGVLVQHVESTEIMFPGEPRNHLYTLDIRFYV